MRVEIADGVHLWFDALGAKRVPSQSGMYERPTVISVHGGPGSDSANDVEVLEPISDYAQLIVFDQRGHGRSTYGSPHDWTLDTWADDIVRLCSALDIKQPVVIGGSFGGFVVQRYATRHPDHAARIGLYVTAPRMDEAAIIERFRQLGGESAAKVIRADFEHSTGATNEAFAAVCLPLMSARPEVTSWLAERAGRGINTPEVNLHFANGEAKVMDHREDLARLRRPTTVLLGELDPMIPVQLGREVEQYAPAGLVETHVVEGAGHLLFRDQPEATHRILRELVER